MTSNPTWPNEVVERMMRIVQQTVHSNGSITSFWPDETALRMTVVVALNESPLRECVDDLLFIAMFADVRSKDDSKTFARVNRGALRTISERAHAALAKVNPNA